ncbi:MAG: hypothetical protein RLZZ440_3065, partial [Planctomycetota bacterium]
MKLASHGESSAGSDRSGRVAKKPFETGFWIVEPPAVVSIVGGMAHTHLPGPEEVDCLIRNAELRDAIEPYLDEAIFEIDFRTLPTEAENRFLESMLAW